MGDASGQDPERFQFLAVLEGQAGLLRSVMSVSIRPMPQQVPVASTRGNFWDR